MNQKDPAFKELNEAISVRYREVHEAGTGAMVKDAPTISVEDMLWESKVIDDLSLLAFQRTTL